MNISIMRRSGQVICGHLPKREIAQYKFEGWILDKPATIYNKHGLPLQTGGRDKDGKFRRKMS